MPSPRRCARSPRPGHQVAVVVSAMGDSTDRLIELAREVSPDPDAARDGRAARDRRDGLDRAARDGAAASPAAARVPGMRCSCRSTRRAPRPRAHRARRLRRPPEADLAAGVVPVVAGFQGRAANGDLTTIGRGGSDTTAVALAVALGADECQILTDVDGVYTTDPRMVPEARRLPAVSFEEMLELAGQGSRVLHLRSVEFAARHGMKLRVLSSFEPGPGTLICEENPNVEAPVVSGIAFNRDEAAIAVSQVPHEAGVAHALLAPVSDAVDRGGHDRDQRAAGRARRRHVHRAPRRLHPRTRTDTQRGRKVRGRDGRGRRSSGEARGRRLRDALARGRCGEALRDARRARASTSGWSRRRRSRSACWSRRWSSSARCARFTRPTVSTARPSDLT